MATVSCSDKVPLEQRRGPDDLSHDYNTAIDGIREAEYPMLQGTTYLDHAGTTLYARSLIEDFSRQMTSTLFGNPHSASSSSQLSSRRIDDIRLRALTFAHADPDQFDLVFVANATAGIKVVMEAFREHEGGFWYGYHNDAHTSLVGVREAAAAGQRCFISDEEVDSWLDGSDVHDLGDEETGMGLFAYPAQSNMNGRRLPLDWAGRLRASRLGRTTYSLLDAAALVSTSPLDLSDASTAPDFTVLSFYKIFGFPDLGALIVRKATGNVLCRRRYFGGGTVELVTSGRESWHIRKQWSLHEQLEDGTLPVHSIMALDCAMDTHERLFGFMDQIARHVDFLARRLRDELVLLRHYNGLQVCHIYSGRPLSYSQNTPPGPIIALNLKNSLGEFVSNTEVEKLANIRNIQLRSGGLCNPGGIASSLDLAPWELKRNFSAGNKCGSENDVIDGKPTGVLRLSLGAMSNLEDIRTFVDFVKEFFLEKSSPLTKLEIGRPAERTFYIETLTVYFIKSCAGWSVPPNMMWSIKNEGLAWDREWCIVHQGTRTVLNQKKYPKMSLVRPCIDLVAGLLRIRYNGPVPPHLDAEITVPLSADPNVFLQDRANGSSSASQVCGEEVEAQVYASPIVALFFTTLLNTPCTLARFPAANSSTISSRHTKLPPRLSPASYRKHPLLLSNESPILAISRSSLNRLNEDIKLTNGKAAHASVFRANLVLAEHPPSPGLEEPYAEDDWQSLCIEPRECSSNGRQVRLDVLGGCRRCQMVCVDQTTAEKDQEPFVTLAKTRRRMGKVWFGVHTALAGGDVPGGAGPRAARVMVGDRVRPG